MCGIAGIYEASGRPAPVRALLSMAGELRHRGPDGSGLYVDGACALANTRLAIVDVSSGDQPLSDDSGRYFVVQNGEIYNHIELRERLEALGHRFATRCDTEVIAHAYARWGLRALDEMNGAFAFALWDRTERKLVLVRDRLGKRPLFLAEHGGALIFGSEAKAVLRYPGLTRELDPAALLEQAVLWSNLGRSAFRGIRELPPGHVLERFADGTTRQRSWWQLSFREDPALAHASDEVLAERVRDLLEDSTRLRLRADVPVAAYLSGGLDSSAIVALAQRHATRGLKLFSVRFDDPLFDERKEQDAVAAALGLPIEAVEVSAADIAGALPDVVTHAERPMLRTAPGPLLLLSRLVRQTGTKVVLTGEGADELFAGYHIFKEDKIRRFWARQPESTCRPMLLRKVHPYLARDLGRTGGFLNAFFGRDLGATDDPLYSHQIRFENSARLVRLLHPELAARAAEAVDPRQALVAGLPLDFSQFSTLGRAQYLEIATFFQSYLLHTQGDRMLMGNSVEGRFPFLDHRLVEFAASLPSRAKLRGLRDKYVLRQAVRPLLPMAITRRPKQPYRAPILNAIAGPGAPDSIRAALAPEAIAAAGLFDARTVELLLRKCRKNVGVGVNESDEMALVFVVTSMLLQRQMVDEPSLARPETPSRIVVEGKVTAAENTFW
ncbi:MAG TPA: asparagine synthase (glutamine-hydrolyzing) [Polyangiaceae bacterium]|nr:asparagine synthase (glutamine-hydrolyzing) [Polyangiaceae bacterium]